MTGPGRHEVPGGELSVERYISDREARRARSAGPAALAVAAGLVIVTVDAGVRGPGVVLGCVLLVWLVLRAAQERASWQNRTRARQASPRTWRARLPARYAVVAGADLSRRRHRPSPDLEFLGQLSLGRAGWSWEPTRAQGELGVPPVVLGHEWAVVGARRVWGFIDTGVVRFAHPDGREIVFWTVRPRQIATLASDGRTD